MEGAGADPADVHCAGEESTGTQITNNDIPYLGHGCRSGSALFQEAGSGSALLEEAGSGFALFQEAGSGSALFQEDGPGYSLA